MALAAGLRGVYFETLAKLGAEQRLVARQGRRGSLLVLNLHRVSPVKSPFWPPLTPDVFEQLLRFLVAKCRIITFDECADAADERDWRPLVVLSFDDGYLDFIDHVVPILQKYGIRANQNVIGSCVSSGEPPWHVRMYDALDGADYERIAKLRLPAFKARLRSDSFGARERFGAALSGFLKVRPSTERIKLLASLSEQLRAIHNASSTKMMCLEEVRQVGRDHELGAHSYSHESMGLVDDATFIADFDRCVELFDDELNVPIRVYAFPNGSYRPRQVELLRKRGVQRMLRVGDCPAHPSDELVSRLTVRGATFEEAVLRAVGHRPPKRLRVPGIGP